MTMLTENKDLKSMTAAKPETPKDPKDLKKFQKYTSARRAMRMITPTGGRITFTNFTYLALDEATVAYLDKEIAGGMREITKGELLSSNDLDPNVAIRNKYFAEFEEERLAKLAAEARGESTDMGSYDAPKLNPAGSNKTAK